MFTHSRENVYRFSAFTISSFSHSTHHSIELKDYIINEEDF